MVVQLITLSLPTQVEVELGCDNIMKMSRETGLDLMACSRQSVRRALTQRTAPKEEEWRVPLLARLLQERRDFIEAEEDRKHLDNIIEVL